MTHMRPLASALLLWAIACGGDPTGPGNSVLPIASRIEVGDTVLQAFAAGDTVALFTIRAEEQADLAIFVQAELGNFVVSVSDSLTEEQMGFADARTDAAAGHLTFSRTEVMSALPGRVLLVRVFSSQPDSRARVRLWVYRVNRAPEQLPNGIVVDDTLQGEDLTNSADIDEFVFDAAAGEEFIAYIQGDPGVAPGGLVLRVLPPTGSGVLTGATNSAGDLELEAQPTGRFVASVAGAYRLAVGHFGGHQGSTEFPGTGSYRLLLRRIDRQPEAASAAVAPGDTIAESIDFVGDVDEFQVQVVADSLYNVFAQMLGSSANASIQLTVLSGEAEIAAVTSSVGDSPLASRSSGRFIATASGALTLRVVGPSDRLGMQRGPYRFLVYPIDRAPELVPAGLTPGDSVTETIESPGDMDEFVVSPSPTGHINLVLRHSVAEGEGISLSWNTGSTHGIQPCFAFALDRCASGLLAASGPIRVTIDASGFSGAYRLVTIPIDTTPEAGPPQIVLGNERVETDNPVGDLDVYELAYSANDLIELEGTGSALLLFVRPDGGGMFGYTLGLPGRSHRFTLPAGGNYRLIAIGRSSDLTALQTGPYAFTIRSVASGTETLAGAASPGDSVTSEPIDNLGDVDDILISAPPGTEVQTFVRGPERLRIDAMVPGTSTVLRTGENWATGRVTIPPSGQIAVRVYEVRSLSSSLNEPGFTYTGPYSIAIHQIDRLPESIGSTMTLGSTVQGESIDLEGDVDEFTFPGTAGQQITGSVSAPFTFDRGRVLLELVDPVSGVVLGSAHSDDAGVESTEPMTLPATRTYVARIRGLDDRIGKGGYRFLVQ